jgi:hypothetical protein
MEELRANIKDAVECHFGDHKPKILRLHIVKDEILSYA